MVENADEDLYSQAGDKEHDSTFSNNFKSSLKGIVNKEKVKEQVKSSLKGIINKEKVKKQVKSNLSDMYKKE